MQKALEKVVSNAIKGSAWQKFTHPTVSLGKTAFPSGARAQQQLGVRFDFHGEKEKDGIMCNYFQMQPNAGDDIPSSIKRWRQANDGTHDVMADVYVKKDGTKEDVEEGLKAATSTVQGA